ncbi:MAG: phosphoribosylformylglycinamidine synthase II, partial [Gemmatimonadales bacterium]|nr:phosphoribosylformylglycinamidine synthase II [Gemmatimonadales bacterium]
TSSSAEMAARGGVGVELDTGLVPTREEGMTPYEILLSESQERMLVVAEPERVSEIQAVCARWELTATAIGRVTDDGIYRVRHHGVVVAAIPGQRLVDDCPIYYPAAREDDAARMRRTAAPSRAPKVDLGDALELLLDTPTIASKRWVYEQYDSTVQASTVIGPGGDAGVLRVPGTGFGLAVTVDCNSRLVALDPYEGGKAAVAEAARNIACTGALPLGITDCLNFGNPEKPEVFYQFREACRGIADACRAFDTPVTGGNVSFYNESPTGAIDPTPTIGMIGLLPRIEHRVPSHFSGQGDEILILGETTGALGGSAYWAEIRDFVGGPVPAVDLDAERRLQRLLVAAAKQRLLRSAHDCAEGGLLVAIAEAAVGSAYAREPAGAAINLEAYSAGVALEGLLYGEDQARAVVSAAPDEVEVLAGLCRKHGVPVFRAGQVGAASGMLELNAGGRLFSWGSRTLRQTYFEAIPRRMQHPDVDRSAGE